MATGSHQFPLPAGAHIAPPSRRAAPSRWAAPDPAALVLDPWAPPLGVTIASDGVAHWPAPVAHTRIRWMAAPASLLPPPAALRALPPPVAPSPATERALATLRAISSAPTDIAELGSVATPALPSPLPPPAPAARSTLPPPDPAACIVDPMTDVTAIRWRVIAFVAAAGASVAAGVTLLAALL